MKRLLPLAVLLAFCARAVSAETEPVKFHVQLIYATNSDKPPQKGWKKVGPKLQKKLSPVFKWKELWEVSRTEVSVPAGQGAKAKLTAERELEIRFQKDGRLELLLYRNAEVVRKMKNMAANERIIMGGESTDRDAWFAVVRRDKPSTE
jgi:hypothetical protein